jgi:DNA-binding PucR family transcriptional regulator
LCGGTICALLLERLASYRSAMTTLATSAAPATVPVAPAPRIGPPGAELVERLLDSIDDLTERMVEHIRTGEHAYVETTRLTKEELRGAVRENLDSLLRTLAGHGPASLAAPRAAGALKAQQGIPLAAVLHAYRLAGRLIWSELIAVAVDQRSAEALPHMASDVWAVIDEYSNAAAEAHLSHTAEQTRRDADARILMLTALLDGAVDAGPRATEILRTLDLTEHGHYVVISAEITADAIDPMPAVRERLRRQGSSVAWIERAGRQIALVGLPTAKRAVLIDRALAQAATSRIGVSRPFSSPLEAARARREAELAEHCLPAGSAGAHVYGASPVTLMIATAPELAGELARTILGPVLDLPAPERTLLLDTLHAWFGAGGSTATAAKTLHCHRNTVLYRLNRIAGLTGRTPADPLAGIELYLAVESVRLTGSVASPP